MFSTYIVFILVNRTYIQWKEKKQISWTPNIKITHLKLFLITIKEGTSDRPHIIYVSILNYSLSFLVTFSIIKKKHCIAFISLQKHNFVQSLENLNKMQTNIQSANITVGSCQCLFIFKQTYHLSKSWAKSINSKYSQ